jgi:hypothetical protein
MSAQCRVGYNRDHTRTKGFHNGIHVLCFDTVYYKVAAAGNEVAVLHDLNVGLAQAQYVSLLEYIIMGAILQSPGTPLPRHHISRGDRRHELYEYCVSACLCDGRTCGAMVSKAQLKVF